MTDDIIARSEIDVLLDRIQKTAKKLPLNARTESLLRIIDEARLSLDVDTSHPGEFRRAVMRAVRVLQCEFGADALSVAKTIQAELRNRAFARCVTRATERSERLNDESEVKPSN